MSEGSLIRKRYLNVETEELKQFLQAFQNNILENVNNKLRKSIDKIVLDLESKHEKPSKENSSTSRKSEKPTELHRKEFVVRDSTLTILWENPEMCSLYNICCAFFFLVYLYLAVFYYFNTQRLKRDLAVVYWTFSEFHIVTAIWLALNLSMMFLLYPTFRFWATNRTFVKKKGLYDAVFCCLFIFYELALLLIPAVVIIVCKIPPASSLIVLTEKVRLFMKSYAFVRENINRSLKYKVHQDNDKEESPSYPCPKVDKLLYFMFAPTLVYRDTYPRTSRIRWNFVGWNLLQMVCAIFCLYLSYICFAVGTFSNVGVKPIPLIHFLGIWTLAIFPGSIVMIVSFYLTLHCWQNCVAEMLRFGDRLFYDDWWNCTSFAKYYRSWNMLVHDWLYSYVYRDMYIVLGRSRTGAMLTVFLISAAVHEYILAVCFKFLFPLLFTIFSTFGVAFVFITRKSTSSFWNIFLWFSLLNIYGLFILFYPLEWYARINCQRIIDSWLDYTVPRIFHCDVISFSSEVHSWDWYPSDF